MLYIQIYILANNMNLERTKLHRNFIESKDQIQVEAS